MTLFGLFTSKKKKQRSLEKQWALNNRYISQIIDGHYQLASKISEEEKAASKKAFDVWMRKEHGVWSDAPKEVFQKRMEELSSGNLSNNFMWKSLKENEVVEDVLLDVFTEPFQSTTDDRTQDAINMKVAELLILKGVTVRNSANYRVKIKHHYVNHKMVKGIIQFDLYKLPTYVGN